MRIGIDIDDTLVNTKSKQIILWEEYVIKNPRKGYTKQLPTFINDFSDEYVSIFWDTYREELSFGTTMKDNVVEVLNSLKKDGHTLCIVTARPKEKYNDLHERLTAWIKDNNLVIDEIYTGIREKGRFTKEANLDILIDDNANYCQSAILHGNKAILFNDIADYDGLKTTSWLEVEEMIRNNFMSNK